MTPSGVKENEIDQQHCVESLEQKCSVPEKIVKINGKSSRFSNTMPTKSRYGRAIKHVYPVEDNYPWKLSKIQKNNLANGYAAKGIVHRDGTENGVAVDEKKVEILKNEIEKDDANEEKKVKIKEEQKNNDDDDDDDDDEVGEKMDVLVDVKIEKKEDAVTTKTNDESFRWVVGQLAWAHVSHYPYWPCIITVDPDLNIYRKERTFGRKKSAIAIHVQYFGDNGRRNWVHENSMMEYTGLGDFQRLAAEALNSKKKSIKHFTGFIVKPKSKKKWDIAVDEAEQIQPLTLEERIAAVQKSAVRKRGRSRMSEEPTAKRQKTDNGANKESINGNSIDIKYNINIDDMGTETPPTPPSSHKDSSDESSISRKSNTSRRKSQITGDFEVYYELKKDDVPKDSLDTDVRSHLKKIWETMSAQQRNKFRRDVEPKNPVRRKKRTQDPEESGSTVEPEQRRRRRSKVKVEKDKDETSSSTDSLLKMKQLNLFKGIRPERVCQICEKTGNLVRCKGPCYSYFHLKCVKPGESESECDMDDDNIMDSGESNEKNNSKEDFSQLLNSKDLKKVDSGEEDYFKCIDCLSGVAPACFICNEREEDRVRCSIAACGKHYHPLCLKAWPQSYWHNGKLTCPYHMCHTCISDNPQDYHSQALHDRLARCVRCPSAYHASTGCLPAGSQILTGSQLICPKHYIAPHAPLNAAWCFLCTRGGSLICCDTCPTSFHPECLGIDAPDGAFICEDCETGRLPLYGEVVWVKLGNFRWWPSKICFPHEIPSKLASAEHSPGEFCIMFFGTRNYHWCHRGRVFLYQDGDSSAKVTAIGKKNVDEAYKLAVDEANDLYQRLKTEKKTVKKEKTRRSFKPPHYVKLKVNKPVGNVKPVEVESMVACECDGNWENPCSSDSDCLNRILSIECSPGICPAGPRCNNQSFVRRNYPAMEPFYTAGRGWGLKSLENIKFGQFVVEYVGEVIDEAEYRRRLQKKKELRNENYYFLTIDNNRLIDAEPKGNLSRFMNHSCQPNCETQKWTVNGDTRIGLFALRDIESGEELTFNYNLASDGETRKPCLCGAPNCSGYIGLKAQKPQLTAVQQKKIEKAEKVKRQKRSKRKSYKCWTCGHRVSESLGIQCGLKSCFKRYHRNCVPVVKDDSNFVCPWHHCLECSRRTSARCSFCSVAYCHGHLGGKLTEQKERGGYLCKAHEDLLFEDDQEPQDQDVTVDFVKCRSPEYPEREPEDSDDDFDAASLLADSDSPIGIDEDCSSPRVSIIEVGLSSEDENSQKEDLDESDEPAGVQLEENPLSKVKRKKNKIKSLGYTTYQLHEIIGGGLLS